MRSYLFINTLSAKTLPLLQGCSRSHPSIALLCPPQRQHPAWPRSLTSRHRSRRWLAAPPGPAAGRRCAGWRCPGLPAAPAAPPPPRPAAAPAGPHRVSASPDPAPTARPLRCVAVACQTSNAPMPPCTWGQESEDEGTTPTTSLTLTPTREG